MSKTIFPEKTYSPKNAQTAWQPIPMGSYFFTSDQFRGLFFSWDTLHKNMYLKSAENLSTNLFFSPQELNQRFRTRSSRPEVFCKKSVLRKFSKLTGKHLCQILFLIKRLSLLKKRLQHRCFPVTFAKVLRTSFLTEHLRWLFL